MSECYAKQMIKTTLERYLPTSKVRSEVYCNTMRPFHPYCLIKMNEEEYLPLNRDYKPLGLNSGDIYEYGNYPFLYIKKEELNLNVLWDNGDASRSGVWFLFSDSTCPHDNLQRYVQILRIVFFGSKEHYDFKELWGHKKRLNYEGWEFNLSRFKNN